MNQRTKFLASLLIGVVVVWFGGQMIFAHWIRPLLNVEGDIAALNDELENAGEFAREFDFAKRDYEKLAGRVGTFDLGDLQDDLHRRIEALGHDRDFEEFKVTPKKDQPYGHTGCTQVGFTITGQQTLEKVLRFVRDLYELPYVIQVSDPRMTAITPPRGQKPKDLIALSLEVESLLLPAKPLAKLDYVVDPKKLPSMPETYVRHGDIDVLALAGRKPFLEYEKPAETKVADTTKHEIKDTGSTKPTTPKPWPGKWKLAVISTMHNPPTSRVLAVNTQKATEQKYVSPGQEFDGGLLESVTTLAALVRRNDGPYVYLLGEEFSQKFKASEADLFPDLKAKAQSLAPLTDDEIRTLSSHSGETLNVTSTAKPTSGKTPSSSNGSSSTSRTTPGRLSSPSRSNGSSSGSAPVRPSRPGSPPAPDAGAEKSDKPPPAEPGGEEPAKEEPPQEEPESKDAPKDEPVEKPGGGKPAGKPPDNLAREG